MRSLHRTLTRAVGIALVSLIVSGCGGSGNGGNNMGGGPVAPPPPPPPPPPTSFNQVVLDEFANTADDTDPRPVDVLDLEFDDDPAAFDSLLQ